MSFLFHRAELRNREMTDLGVQALNVVLFALQLSLFCGGLLIAHRYGKLSAAVKSMQDHINLSALICFKHPVLYIFCPKEGLQYLCTLHALEICENLIKFVALHSYHYKRCLFQTTHTMQTIQNLVVT